MEHFDLIILGAGSGNSFVGPEHDHLKIAMVERNLFGGTCLNVGCIPTKMFTHTADVAYQADHSAPLGLDIALEKVRWTDIRDRIFGRIDPIPPKGKHYREHLDNWTVFDGTARFVGPKTVEVLGADGSTTISGDQIVIATGASAVIPHGSGFSDVPYETSDTVMRLETVPRHLMIIGGGFIACEMAHIFGSFGAEITIMTRGKSLLPRTDRAISAAVTEEMSRRFTVLLERSSGEVTRDDAGEITITTGATTVTGDVVLLATGRDPNTADLNLSVAGVEVDDRGYVISDDQMRTTAPGIWALGDVTTDLQLKHVANAEARIVGHNIINPDDLQAMDYEAVPYAVFTKPQVGTVGATEQHLERIGQAYRVYTQRYADVAYGWAIEDTTSFCKVLSDEAGERVLGAHIVGPNASMLVQLLVQGMRLNTSISEMARGQLWIHPALSELVENALLGILNQGPDDVIHPVGSAQPEELDPDANCSLG